MNSQEVLYNLKVALVENLPLHYTIPGYGTTFVAFKDKGTGDNYEFRYEPVKGSTTVLQMYVNEQHVRGFENAEQVVSFFYAKESAK
jgi:hypothetical protein